MNWKSIAKLAAAHGQATAILVAVTVASAGFAGWLHEHDARIRDSVRLTDSLTIAHGRELAATKARDSLTAIAAHVDTQLVHDTVRVHGATTGLAHTIAALPDSLTTAADTQHAIAALPAIRQQADSTVRACTELANTCAEYRRVTGLQLAASDSVIAALRAQLAIVPRLDRAQAPTHRVSLSVTGGYGAVHDATGWHTGPALAAGLSWRIW